MLTSPEEASARELMMAGMATEAPTVAEVFSSVRRLNDGPDLNFAILFSNFSWERP
jgi:hypothetical protein